ncbi:MAG: 2-succinyl-5-enolpyruvyl-6-hydroxy-3-cyclohexene-1-carboxylic-acid synthase [Caldilineaceae bacterium]|nr:2-succinyl-5-enolpyruvyl-6-hydroxy-3-cyclohexene-1-carboxylic-acid synthase [Caldilineaceae bacterium]
MNRQNHLTNPSLLYAETLVHALAAAGLRDVCIAPGSRSTPLTLAFDAHPDVTVHLHLDERCAGFYALGLAMATEQPVALVCTSGTAAVEFHPAVVEAQMSNVPLLVLTADRPPELRHSGANQTIDQVKMYGNHVLWAVDVGLPEAAPPAVALRNLRATAARALAVADGIVKGPVHLNLPFRKPLEPDGPYNPDFGPGLTTRTQRGTIHPSAPQIDKLAELIAGCERGVIICGPRCPGGDFPAAVAELARRSGYPIFADPLSGLRFGPHIADAPVIGCYETLLNGDPGWGQPELVIRFGAVPTSKWLNEWLEKMGDGKRQTADGDPQLAICNSQFAPPQLHIRADGVWSDDSHRVSDYWQADESLTCWALAARISRSESDWTRQLLASERRFWQAASASLHEEWFDVAAVAALVEALPDGANLFVGNSLPIRHVDQFAQPSIKRLQVYGNRGASGIDGVTSSALGVAAAERTTPTVLLIGDISFYHDLNGLLAVQQQKLENVTIVLLNNDGGSIFRRLPIAGQEPAFTRLFLTPHSLDFAPVIRMYRLEYVQADSREALQNALAESIDSRTPTVIEVRTDGARDEELRRGLGRRIRSSITDVSSIGNVKRET